MSDQGLRLFISYSRLDSSFVDVLVADLSQRGFDPWVDREHLEGGDDWQARLELELKRSDAVLVAIPAEDAALEWVRREVEFTRRFGKFVIPLRIRSVGNAEILILDLEQYVDFSHSYEEGRDALLVALYHRVMLLPPEANNAMLPSGRGRVSRVSKAQKGAPAQDARLESLYIAAQATDDLERRNRLYEQILIIDPQYLHGRVMLEREQLQPQLHRFRLDRSVLAARRYEATSDWHQAAGEWQVALKEEPENKEAQIGLLRSLHSLADDAYRHGWWADEIAAWETAIGITPTDNHALERLAIARANLDWAADYELATKLFRGGKRDASERLLEHIWQEAPYFGDPSNIAQGLGLPAPSTLEQVEANIARSEHLKQEAERLQQDQMRSNAMLPKVKLKPSGPGVQTVSALRSLFGHAVRVRAPEVQVPRRELRVGEPFVLKYSIPISETMRIKCLVIELNLAEEVKFAEEFETHDSDGPTTTRKKRILHVVGQYGRYVHEGGRFHKGRTFTGEQLMQIPPTLMHTFDDGNFRVHWFIRITLELDSRRGVVVNTYDIVVVPKLYE